MKNIAICASVAVLLGACAAPSTPQSSNLSPAKASEPERPKSAAATSPSSLLPPYKDPTNILYKERAVYFDFDDYSVKPIYDTALVAHGKFLRGASATHIRVEGNSDERGSTEYNLALGQKRAEAVKKMLIINGGNQSQIEAVSYGKERPKAQGHNETAWSQNRRAEIVYP